MKFAYWTPVFGSWLRNVDNDPVPVDWDYIKNLALEAEAGGFTLTLVPELYLNDIKGQVAPALDAWAVANALAAITSKIEILAALRPQYHKLAITAKKITTIAHISKNRFSVNLVSAWWQEEARQYGIDFDGHDDRYGLMQEYTEVLRKFWSESPVNHKGKFFEFSESYNEPKPQTMPLIYAGGESEKGRESIAQFADIYLMHGGSIEEVREKIADMKERRKRLGRTPLKAFGMAAYVILRNTEEEAQAELKRITNIKNEVNYKNSYSDFTSNSELDVEISKRDYSVSNRGLRPNLIGTAETIAATLREYEKAGLNLVIIQTADMKNELRKIAKELIPIL
ncbi:alkanesulfonate monooxygenase [Helicobacter sp. 12S02232-10]|uniref:LLM class flavin-dependent oxidoreductase n=1 Tax=Helicobacter sp. 12S02232-10 TaxID=1476197 RepID=UPI000BA5695A|nr:LLM class flavin-dependent oxidoreductase [Helicobacter sp. 12S02232-10]PAF46607.1 alkanesulfonate monooxygenase [Helicobacter sp. 12S02232-10]